MGYLHISRGYCQKYVNVSESCGGASESSYSGKALAAIDEKHKGIFR